MRRNSTRPMVSTSALLERVADDPIFMNPRHASLPGMTDLEQFRADGHAAIDWAADYLEGVRDLPVMSTVAPGEIRAHLPAAPPEQAEAFADVLADVDRVLMPGVTHWNHPRFFAYFSITGSQPGILAELLTATLNLNGMLWRTSPAVTELEQVTLSWMCQLLGLPEAWHGHIEDSASTSTLAALCAARTVRRIAASSSRPSTPTRPSTAPAAS